MYRTLRQDVLADLMAQYSLVLHPNKRSYILTCPVPECDKPKLYIEKATGRGICFHCGLKGYADYILSMALHLPQRELSDRLYGGAVDAGTGYLTDEDVEFVDWWGEEEQDIIIEDELPDLVWSPSHRAIRGTVGAAYLNYRDIPLEVAEEYQIKYDPSQRRVVFPIIVNGCLKGWQARSIVDATPKMLTFGAVGGKALMFHDRLIGSKHAILCEGPVDALKCHMAGGNVAAMGKGVTPQQIAIILKHGVQKLYLGLDPDAADDTMRVIREATAWDNVKMYLMEPPQGAKDLGDLTLEAAFEVFKSAPRVYPGQLFVHF